MCYKGIVMQQRVILLFLLFVVLSVFYASFTGDTVPTMSERQQAQTEMFENIEENALKRPDASNDFSGD